MRGCGCMGAAAWARLLGAASRAVQEVGRRDAPRVCLCARVCSACLSVSAQMGRRDDTGEGSGWRWGAGLRADCSVSCCCSSRMLGPVASSLCAVFWLPSSWLVRGLVVRGGVGIIVKNGTR
eukprot:COSAG01_NODE_6521_length_3623_cov_21.897276_1_plen_122_part_00